MQSVLYAMTKLTGIVIKDKITELFGLTFKTATVNQILNFLWISLGVPGALMVYIQSGLATLGLINKGPTTNEV